jgi:hypothetical protein
MTFVADLPAARAGMLVAAFASLWALLAGVAMLGPATAPP